MRALRQGPGLPPAVMTADHTFGQFLIARGPARLHPREARTMARVPARTAAGSRPHAATTSARSGGTALDFTLVLCSPPPFFQSETRFLRILPHLEPRAFSARGKQLRGIIEERVQTMARITTGRLNVQYVWSPVESPTKPSAVAPLNSAVPSTASAVYRWACWNLGHGDDVKRFPWASPPQRGKHSARFRPLTGSPDPT